MIVRSYTAAPSHISCAIIMGYFLSKFRNNKKLIFLFLGLIIPMMCHALYNFTLVNNFNLVIAYHTQGKEYYQCYSFHFFLLLIDYLSISNNYNIQVLKLSGVR